MDSNYEVWKTMYEKDFNKEMFLYHYTSISKAFKIISGNKLKFSKLSCMNDTLESKPKLSFSERIDYSVFEKIIECFRYTNNNYLQLLCMSKEPSLNISASNEREYYSDYSCRGFALPRMWAQYADNNNGVCLIFDRKKLIEKIEDVIGSALIHEGEVNYVAHFKPFDIDLKDVLKYVKRTSEMTGISRNINDIDFLKRYKNFVIYNYFSKLIDWKNENEYRFLAYGDQDYYIPGIIDTISGIVVGESIEDSDLKIIDLLCKKKFEIMKISFNIEGCTLENFDGFEEEEG